MENPRLEKEEIIKNIRNIVRLENEQNDTVIKDIRNLKKGINETKASLKELKIQNIEILKTFLSMKNKKKLL